ncbi:MAG: hypothetical protein R2789_00405 [Microthrixaceae bacterium]
MEVPNTRSAAMPASVSARSIPTSTAPESTATADHERNTGSHRSMLAHDETPAKCRGSRRIGTE